MKAVVASGAALLLLTGCAANEAAPETEETPSSLTGTLSGAGASSMDAAQQQGWIAGFQTANSGVTINYDPSGSGAGRESFQKAAVAFAGSDRAFKTDEITAGPFDACTTSNIIEIPAYISPIAVVFNVEGIDNLNLDAATIANIFSGKISNWNDAAIAELNPDASLPDQAIVPVHRSDKSGTTGNFTDYLGAAAPEAWTAGSVEEWPADITGGEAAQGTSGLIEAVKGGVGTIGYADASRADGLGTVSVKVGDEFVAFTPEAAAAIVDASPLAEGRTAGDLAIELDRTSTEAGVYPIVLVSYLIGCESYADPANAELVKSYFSYIVSEDGQDVAAQAAGSAPISDSLREKAVAAIDSIS